jgi:hypothetical protein
MNFIEEWKKFLACIVGIVFLLLITHFTGEDMMPWVRQLLDTLVVLLGASAVRYSVLKTSEREKLKGN